MELLLKENLSVNPEEKRAFTIFSELRGLAENKIINPKDLISKIDSMIGQIGDVDLLSRLSALLNNFAKELSKNLRKEEPMFGRVVDPEVDRKIDNISGMILKIENKINSLQKDGVEEVIKKARESGSKINIKN